MPSHAHIPNVLSMTLTLHEIHAIQVRTLDARQAELEQRIERCRVAIRAAGGHNPSLGRELDAARSLLAQVHAELALLHESETVAAR